MAETRLITANEIDHAGKIAKRLIKQTAKKTSLSDNP